MLFSFLYSVCAAVRATGSRGWNLPPPEMRPEDSEEATATALESPFLEVRTLLLAHVVLKS